jgi:beta-lactamase regulating signal transducer with metallopeptidase domain
MNLLETLMSMSIVEALGWALIHFVWQGALIAVVAALVLHLLRRRSANTRYLVGCGAMALMIVAPIATMIAMWPGAAAPAVAAPAAALAEPTAWERLTPLLPWFTVVWIVGVLVLQTRLILNWSHVQHLRQFGTKPVAARWQTLLEELSEQMGVRQTVRIVESSIARAPMMIGWLRPVILVPTTALTGLTPQQLRTIIAHELTHVRRHDYLVNLVQAVFETLLFYHPAVWWLSNRIRVEREYCCDDAAVSVCGDALCYAKALSSLDELRDGTIEPALASTGGSLMNRIYRIAGVPVTQRRGISGWPLLVVMSVTAAVSAMAVSTTTPDADVAPAEVKPIDRVNIPGILREMGSEDADMIGLLSEAGLDNRVLMVVLEEIGAQKAVFEHIEKAAHRADFIESRMPEVREHVTKAIATGKLSVPEAEEKLARARMELMHRYHLEQRRRHADRMTDEVAVEHLAALERHVAEGQVDFVLAPSHVRPAHDAKLEAIVVEVHEALAAGDISRQEAHEKLMKVHAEIEQREGEWITAEVVVAGETAPVADVKLEQHFREIEVKYNALEADIDAAMAAGELTDDEAARKLMQVRLEMDLVREKMAAHREAKPQRVHLYRVDEDVARGEYSETRAAAPTARVEREYKGENMWYGVPLPPPHAVPAGVPAGVPAPLPPPHAVPAGVPAPHPAHGIAIVDGKPVMATTTVPARVRMRAPRPALSVEDRQALRKGVAAATDRVRKQAAEGRLTAEQAEKKIAHLKKLEARLNRAPKAPAAHPAPTAPLPPEPPAVDVAEPADIAPIAQPARPVTPAEPAPADAPSPRD